MNTPQLEKKYYQDYLQVKKEDLLITPELAEELLKKNPENNRPLDKHLINVYARSIKMGNWTMGGPGHILSFGENGLSQDGQHRLHAIIKAQIAIMMEIHSNLPNDNIFKIDTGKSRSAGDSVKLSGVDFNPRVQSSIAKYLINYTNKQYKAAALNSGKRERYIENIDIVNYIKDNSKRAELIKEATEKAIDCCSETRYLRPNIVGAYYVMFGLIDKQKADEFFEGYKNGANLSVDSPILLLREKLKKNTISTHKATNIGKVSWFVTAWNMFIQNKTGKFNTRKDIIEVEDENGKNVQQDILERISNL